MTCLKRMLKAFKSIQATQPQLVSANNVKRAAVALILRFRPLDGFKSGASTPLDEQFTSLDQLFSQSWMQDANVIPEVRRVFP